MQPEDDLIARLRAALKRLDAEIEDLAAKARQVGDEARTRYADDLERLKRRRVELEVRLEALRWAGEATFGSLARGLEEGAALARKAFRDASERFRQS